MSNAMNGPYVFQEYASEPLKRACAAPVFTSGGLSLG
jgi:hypothetical protein